VKPINKQRGFFYTCNDRNETTSVCFVQIEISGDGGTGSSQKIKYGWGGYSG